MRKIVCEFVCMVINIAGIFFLEYIIKAYARKEQNAHISGV